MKFLRSLLLPLLLVLGACSPAAKADVKSAVDVASAVCALAPPIDPVEATICATETEVGPLVSKLLAHRAAKVSPVASSSAAPDGGVK